MPESPAAARSVDLQDAPSGDLSFDSLFPAEPSDAQLQAAPPPQPVTAAPPVPAAPQAPPAAVPEEPFLQGSKSVYKTRDAAIDGINQKDVVIEQLRQRFVLATGVDPLTNRPASAAPAAPQSPNYAQDAQRYVTDVAAALQRGDVNAYRDAHTKLIFDVLEPVAPALFQTLEEQALRKLDSEVPNSRSFVGSADYQSVLEANPDLRDAIEISRSDMRLAPRLPGLYKLAYQASQGMRLPELLKAQQPQPPAQPTPVRTTTPATTPDAPSPAPVPTLNTSEGRKAIIEAFERGGGANRVF